MIQGLCNMFSMHFIIFSEIVLGEYIVNQDPDCDETNTNCNPIVIRRGIKKIIVHENYEKHRNEAIQFANDIALIRLDQSVPLNSEDPNNSVVKPICLPWKRNDFGRKTEDVFGYVKLFCLFLFLTHLSTIQILRKQIFGLFLTHPPSMYLLIVSKNGHFLNPPSLMIT